MQPFHSVQPYHRYSTSRAEFPTSTLLQHRIRNQYRLIIYLIQHVRDYCSQPGVFQVHPPTLSQHLVTYHSNATLHKANPLRSQIADEYDSRFASTITALEAEIKQNLSVLNIKPNGRLLDYACGTGVLSRVRTFFFLLSAGLIKRSKQ